ncbi:MAG TPA: RNase adapter RapZ [Desulfurivibrionaceae bacterium]|nr:RNase adapter RapZ [Desulfurivibrionaceae bacterium]
MNLSLFSFGHKHGPPQGADLVFDARLLPNPYWVPEFKEHNGTEPVVAAYVLDNETGREFLSLLLPWLRFCITTAQQTDRESLTIAIGCTGGRHRSVAVVEELGRQLADLGPLTITHRDLTKE